MTIMAISSVACAGPVVGLLDSLDDYGEAGEKIEGSVYFRAFCYLCSEPIRVPRRMLSFPNTCSGCIPDYRGKPGVIEAERSFYFEQFLLDAADRAE